MPVLVVAVYDENGTVQCMNAAWGQICDTDKIALFLDPDHARPGAKPIESISRNRATETDIKNSRISFVSDGNHFVRRRP